MCRPFRRASLGRVGTYTTAEHGNPAEMGEPNSSGHALIGMASAVERRMGLRRGETAGRAGPDPHAWEGLSWPLCTDFFGLFVFMS